MALAGLSFSGCRRPEKHLVPFSRGVEWAIPGKALFFATSMPSSKGGIPLVVATHDGRPTKVDGNVLHPLSKGSSPLLAQSSILDLYDPDRARFFRKDGRQVEGSEFESALEALAKGFGDGSGLAFLAEPYESPTRDRLVAEIRAKYPKARWVTYDPVGPTPAAVYGEGVLALPRFDRAKVILALDHDFLGVDATGDFARQFAAQRKPDSKSGMNRLYVAENRFTLTGGMADHRIRVQASQIGAFAVAIAREVLAATKDAGLQSALSDAPASSGAFQTDWVREAAADLVSAKGRSLVLAGPRQPQSVQVLVAALNTALGSLGKTLVGRRAPAQAGVAGISGLAAEMAGGSIKALFVLGGNPSYNAPADLEWEKLQKAFCGEKGGVVVRLSFHEDETSSASTWQVPMAHPLESWGDARAFDGSYLSVQPMILPLFGGWSELDLLAVLAGRKKPEGPELVQDTFRQSVKPQDFTAAWSKFLHDGFASKAAQEPAVELALNGALLSGCGRGIPGPLAADAYEVVLVEDAKVQDGRHANNGWLQELPDPVTKLAWDNAALVSPTTAKQMGLENGDMVEVAFQKRSIQIPVFVVPGHADRSLTIPLGYGRSFGGRVGGRGVGFNAYPLLTKESPYVLAGAAVRRMNGKHQLVVTQEHGAIEGRGADLLREGTLAQYKEEPDFAKAMGLDAHAEWSEKNGRKSEVINRSLYSHPPLNDVHQWGMTIDLSTCTGCSSCMVACQAENNIPVVGKEQVGFGREMHWIRTDRYFASENDDVLEPEMIYQPMLCQHCESAPCETVCPVNATVHSEDGLNVMAYNRCIGTRYCANNCPFKVRRFNFFDYNQRKIQDGGLYEWNLLSAKGTEETVKMQKNPNVTVRMRGVMEKCTFCVQRIQEAKVSAKVLAKDSNRIRIPADKFTTACAQACPTEAITFGDISNPESSVSKVRASERGYRLLEYLNIGSRVWYLARIRNPNPKMPDAAKVGAHSRPSHHGGGHHEVKAHHTGGEA